jgi:ketol-acid reductoisomerase
MHTYFTRDADLTLIKSKRVAVIGYGNQGHAHALNMRDSGVTGIVVGARPGASAERARAAGFTVVGNADAAKDADIVVMGAPDELLPEIYARDLAPAMKQGAALLFIHGFAIHFGLIEPRADLDVLMVAPAGPGAALRSGFLAGNGLLGLIAVHRDVNGTAKDLALAYGAAIGCGVGMIETTFKDETETDLFGEQSVLCGGSVELIRAGFETLVEAGYAPELAYFECMHQLKLIVDLVHARGIAGMYKAISNTAEYGAYRSGPRVINAETKAEMKRVLADVQSGRFAREFMADSNAGGPEMAKLRARAAAHAIEDVGTRLRAMMPWLDKSK